MNPGLRTLLALSLTAVIAASCGKEGLPKPPESELPDPVKDLTLKATRGAVELKWSVPQKNQDGSKPPDVTGFQVMHSLLPIVGDTNVTASKPELAFVLPVPVDVSGTPLKQATVRDATAVPETVNVYRVLTFGSSGFGTDPSNSVSIAWAVPPSPPPSLDATAGERAAALHWTAPTTGADGKPETRSLWYRVYRWTGEAEPELVSGEPLVDTSWTDTSPAIDQTHSYVVRSVVKRGDAWIESDDSPTASIVSEDRTPPAPPKEVVGVHTPNGIELRWDPSPDVDVAGYYVYRLRPNGAADKLTPNLVEGTRYVDPHPPVGDVRYRVTAVDKSANANESAPSSTATVQ